MGGKSSKQVSRQRVERNHEETEECIEKLPYFYAELSRTQAEDVMRRHIGCHGSFLVRLSSHHRRYTITVIVSGKIGHVSIHAPRQNCFYAEDDRPFTKLSNLIHYYHGANLPNNTNEDLQARLKYPVYRFRQPMPFPFQQNAIIYDLGSQSRNRVYHSVGEHIERWRKLCRFDEVPQMSIFQDEDGQVISLPLPPQRPQNPITTSSSIEDVTEPKQVLDTPMVLPTRYLKPMRYSKQTQPNHCPPCAEHQPRQTSTRVYYTPMMPISVGEYEPTEPVCLPS